MTITFDPGVPSPGTKRPSMIGRHSSKGGSNRKFNFSSIRSAGSVGFKVGDMSSYEALLAGGDKHKENLLRRKDANLDSLMNVILQEHLKQKLASEHFASINTWLLFVPTMGITLLSAIISIFSTSEIVRGENLKVELGIAVSFFQILLSVLQSLSKQLNLSARAGYHKSAAVTLKKILDQTRYTRTEDKYQSIYNALKTNSDLSIGKMAGANLTDDQAPLSNLTKSTSSSSFDDLDVSTTVKSKKKDTTDLFEDSETPQTEEHDDNTQQQQQQQQQQQGESNNITKQYLQALEQVDSFVPTQIISAFNLLQNRIMVINNSMLTNKNPSMVAWEQVMPALYFQLHESIINSWAWPYFVPSATSTVEHCLKTFKESLNVEVDNNADLLMEFLDRSNQIRSVQERLMLKQTERKARRSKRTEQSKYSSTGDATLDTIRSGIELETDKITRSSWHIPSYGTVESESSGV